MYMYIKYGFLYIADICNVFFRSFAGYRDVFTFLSFIFFIFSNPKITLIHLETSLFFVPSVLSKSQMFSGHV